MTKVPSDKAKQLKISLLRNGRRRLAGEGKFQFDGVIGLGVGRRWCSVGRR